MIGPHHPPRPSPPSLPSMWSSLATTTLRMTRTGSGDVAAVIACGCCCRRPCCWSSPPAAWSPCPPCPAHAPATACSLGLDGAAPSEAARWPVRASRVAPTTRHAKLRIGPNTRHNKKNAALVGCRLRSTAEVGEKKRERGRLRARGNDHAQYSSSKLERMLPATRRTTNK